MPANLQPIFPLTPFITIAPAQLLTANTAKDGTGTVVTIATGTTNGSRIDTIKARALGTNASATVLRLFINNGGANSTPTNNSLFLEVSLPATTLSETTATTDIVIQFDALSFPQVVLPSGYKINATIGTAVAAGWQITVFGGNY